MSLDNDVALEHYGVKGMKWGVRKAPEVSGIGSSDRTINKGSEILYVSDRKYKEGKSNRLYSSYTKSDKATYSDLIASFGDNGRVYHNTFKVKSDLKVPSDKRAAEIFTKMAKEDPKSISKDMARAYQARVGLPLKTAKSFEKKISKLDSGNVELGEKLYSKYNKMLVADMTSSSNFYGRLVKEGYGALSDLNDRGKMAQDPLIIFNHDKKLSHVSSVPLSTKDVESYIDYVMTREYKRGKADLSSVKR